MTETSIIFSLECFIEESITETYKIYQDISRYINLRVKIKKVNCEDF